VTSQATSATTDRTASTGVDPTTPATAADPDPTPAPATTTTTAAPAPTTVTTPPAPAILQSEGGVLTAPAVVRSDHPGYTGTGFVGDLILPGATATMKVESTSNGTIGYTIRYASPPAGPEGDRTLTLSVNGVAVKQVIFQPSGGATTWATVTGTVELQQGPVQLTLGVAEGDTGWVNVDYLSLP
jgi:hypothetical protein